jgi:hypothetical protein
MIPVRQKEIRTPLLKSRCMPIRDDLLPTLRAVLARLVPTDQDPGGAELGAEAFIRGRIVEYPDLQMVYERGLEALTEQDFLSQPAAGQDELLRQFDTRYPEFMAVAAAHAIEAVYTHPIGLAMVGFEVNA